ncbi:MAG TPA: hypothetical protein VEB00_11695 [Clostridia bacterium]|nr:hypothetical protein [Clostridia bacterium]
MIRMFNKKTVIRFISLGMSTVVLVGVGLLAGCTTMTGSGTAEKDKPEDKNPPVVQENKQDKIMPEFMALVEGNAKPDAIIGFIGNYIASVSRDNAAIMLGELEKVQKNYLVNMEKKYYDGDTIQNSLNKVYKPGFDLNKIDDIQDAELKNLLIETRDMGYKVETSEGMYYPIMNYEYLKKYSIYALEDIMEYIDIMAVETNKVPAKDAALVIGWDEVIERALAQESFIKKYGSSAKIESMKELQKRYVTFMLYGLNNTPLFSYDTNTMEPEAKETYAKAVKDNGNSELMQMLGKYMELLEKSKYKFSEEIDTFRKNAVGSN